MPNNAFRLKCGRKIVYIPQQGPTNLQAGRTMAPGMGVQKECCSCACEPSCQFNCEWNDTFDEALDTDVYLLTEDWTTAGDAIWATENDALVLKYLTPNVPFTSLTSYYFSHLSFGVEITFGDWIDTSPTGGTGRPHFRATQYSGLTNLLDVQLRDKNAGEIPHTFHWIWVVAVPATILPSVPQSIFDNPVAGDKFTFHMEFIREEASNNVFYTCFNFNGELLGETPEVDFPKDINYAVSLGGGWTRHDHPPAGDPPLNTPLLKYFNFCASEVPNSVFCDSCDDLDLSYKDAARNPDILNLMPIAAIPTDGTCPCASHFSEGFNVTRDAVDPCLWTYSEQWCEHGTGCTVTTEVELSWSTANNGTWDLTVNLVNGGDLSCVFETLVSHYNVTFRSCGYFPSSINNIIQRDDITSICGGTFPTGYTLNPATDPDQALPTAMMAAASRAMSVSSKPGTAVASLFTKYKCDGRSYIHTMNNNGLQWCLQNMDLICDWIGRTAKMKKLPYDKEIVRTELINILENLSD